MKLLQEAIEQRGTIINDDILKVDSFLNHQIDCRLMKAIGQEFAAHFQDQNVTKIVTIESSGIAPAVFAGDCMDVPVIFMKKSEPSTMLDPVYTEAFSFTKNRKYTLCMERQFLSKNDRVLFIDDFLANGQAFLSAEDLIQQCGAHVVGVGIVIEKSFQKGRALIEEKGYDIYSLARIQAMKDNKILWK
ncbi:xanthine phosphoribosyltransferase [Faecalicoccus acidiformans]|uniref:Xanthine phosphoribosyltransferase n=1 Tax=Faecalicoccus acidiformans TaxID=915173 RepID=A0A7W8FXZ5_9FIRM|nr:xanthine phosphoribosyltransferase [Faecalicoccus acidiformans]MBB5184255.1 xanthine phosphoribosyltransferase [Faecalicoccus acidiformans]